MQMKKRTEPKYVVRRTIAQVLIGQATLIMYVAIFVYGMIL